MLERWRGGTGWARRGVLGLPLLLAACGTSRRTPPAPTGAAGEWSCVPYARQRSGIPLRGDAWEWWEAASGQYRRERRPRPGSVLVLMRTSRLPRGHLSVVSRVISAREIRVDHANWASGRAKGRVATDQPVLDVSPGNDWSLVRIWYPRVNDFGASRYPAYGFIAAT
ncbi:CHAP domain-containing protein [Siccirubricoccus phaeus]|uniref:CHAP domain-containing protein n=1 Tax=Siccirubricoccus phaeus TaxID=2595053 RepID=UPI0011F37A50|nr:CHAP domain-containing protein [Siccirubricoccus phaeus]